MSKTFWGLVYESVIFRGLLAVILLGAVIFMAIEQIDVPEWLQTLALVAIGYFFGAPLPTQYARKIEGKLDAWAQKQNTDTPSHE